MCYYVCKGGEEGGRGVLGNRTRAMVLIIGTILEAAPRAQLPSLLRTLRPSRILSPLFEFHCLFPLVHFPGSSSLALSRLAPPRLSRRREAASCPPLITEAAAAQVKTTSMKSPPQQRTSPTSPASQCHSIAASQHGIGRFAHPAQSPNPGSLFRPSHPSTPPSALS